MQNQAQNKFTSLLLEENQFPLHMHSIFVLALGITMMQYQQHIIAPAIHAK